MSREIKRFYVETAEASILAKRFKPNTAKITKQVIVYLKGPRSHFQSFIGEVDAGACL